MHDFDLFVIGAGSGGVRSARMAARDGARVAVAEGLYLGGTCVNVGCIPKKLYTYAAHFRYDFEDSRNYGWSGLQPRFDWTVLRDNKQREIARLNQAYNAILDSCGATILKGRARIVDPHTVEVAGQRYSSRYILVATGGWPFVPEFPGREYAITSNEVFDLAEFPRRVLVVGGGYIAVELAGIFAGLGAETHLSYRKALPLRGFDQEIREFFLKEMGRHVHLQLETTVDEVARNDDGSLRVCLGEGRDIEVDCVLFATGRRPNTEGLGLENTKVESNEDGTLKVNEYFQTAEPSIYALGDVVGRMELTPVALAEGMVLADHLFGGGKRRLSYDNIPTAIFSHPNIGVLGLCEEEARRRHGEVTVFKSDFRHLKHTISGREERTFMKVLVNPADDRVLGMHMVGENAGEILQGFAAAMKCGLTKAQLDATIGIHPTAAEEFVTMRDSVN